MKWGNYPQITKRVISSKWVYYLALVLGAALLAGASRKWTG